MGFPPLPAGKNCVVSAACNRLTRSHATCKKGGDFIDMRTFALLALVAVTFGFAACAKNEPAPTPAPTKGYSK